MRKYMTSLVSALDNDTFAQAATARVENGVFYSYSTPIAIKKDGRYYLTLDKFSKTTSCQQYTLLRVCPGARLSVVPHKQIMEMVAAR